MMPLTMYEENSNIPYIADVLGLKQLWHSNLGDLQQKARELDTFIKWKMYREGYKETLGSYDEIHQQAVKELNLSSNLDRLEKLNRLHTRFKVLNEHKKNKKATG